MEKKKAFNPLDKKNLGLSVADAMLLSEIHPLPPGKPFVGAGIYAIYYTGTFPKYKEIAKRNKDGHFLLPIYVGKAVPAGARKGSTFDDYEGTALYNRLKEHAESIKQIPNLKIKDFFCRYLVVEDIWIPLGETLLINMFSPLWNRFVDGFGNHDPGSGRHNSKKSPWDILHPGRKWVDNLKGVSIGMAEIDSDIKKYLKELEELEKTKRNEETK